VPDHDVLFGASLGQWNGADAADAAGRVKLAIQAGRDGLDLFTVADHPYFGDKLDAYALTGFLLGRTERITGMVTVTNLPSRPAPGWPARSPRCPRCPAGETRSPSTASSTTWMAWTRPPRPPRGSSPARSARSPWPSPASWPTAGSCPEAPTG